MTKVTTTDNEGEAGRDEGDKGDVQGHDGEHPEVSNSPIPIPALLLPRGHAMGHNSSLTTFRASQHCRAARARPHAMPTPCVAPRCSHPIVEPPGSPENAQTRSGVIYILSATRRLQARGRSVTSSKFLISCCTVLAHQSSCFPYSQRARFVFNTYPARCVLFPY